MKILIMTDSMFLPSGLGRVGREIAVGLSKKGHEIGYIGWHHRNDINMNVPQGMTFWPTNDNLYGSNILDTVVARFRPDIVMTIGDMWSLAWMIDPGVCKTRRYFQWCAYIPVDGEPINGGLPPALIPVIEDVDIPVAYTDYAKNAILKSVKSLETKIRIRTIYHGVDTAAFRPLSWTDRKKARIQLGLDDRFVFLCVARNQSRKNIPELFRAWKIFSELPDVKDKVVLWPHMVFTDPMGWNIGDYLTILELRNRSVMYYQEVAYSPSEFHLIPENELVKLYQIADAFVLISGEGFGLPTFEAMATGVPCVLLDEAASSELGDENRAVLVPKGGEITWTGMHLTQRAVPLIDDVVGAMMRVYKDRRYREEVAQRGFEFATRFTWDQIVNEWNMLFLEHEVPFIKPLELETIC